MKIDILTLFPNMFDGFLHESIVKRAIESKKVKINVHNIRDYSDDKHKKVDDTPYGGGSGMVLMCQPIFDAVEDLKSNNTKVILMTPQGIQYSQKLAYTLSQEDHLIFICGHYEGFDERIRSIVDMEISIGDYILTGGELPSMVVTDSIVRLVDGVIDKESHQKESFNDDLLDYPTYTKPQEYKGMKVPDVLMSGHHENIENWRQTEKIIRTMERRPDLIRKVGSYAIIKDADIKKIAALQYDKIGGYDLTPKNDAKRTDVINVTKMLLVKPSFVEKVIKRKIEKRLKLLLDRITLLMATENPNDDDTQIILDELDRYRKMIINNYVNYLGVEYRDLIVRRINIIINEIRMGRMYKIDDSEREIGGKSR